MNLLLLLTICFLTPFAAKSGDLGSADLEAHIQKNSMGARCVEPWSKKLLGTRCKLSFADGKLRVDSGGSLSRGISANQVRYWSSDAPPRSPIKFFQIIYLNSKNQLTHASFGFDHADAATEFMANFLKFLNSDI